MLELSEAAWAVLIPLWVQRWTLILGLGATPWLASRLFAVNKLRLPAQFSVFRQTCAFAACLVAVWSFQLAADTYFIEAGEFESLQTLECSVQARSAHTVGLVCQNGQVFDAITSQAGASARAKLYLLPNSGLPVYFGD